MSCLPSWCDRRRDRGALRVPVAVVLLLLGALVGPPALAQDGQTGVLSAQRAWELSQRGDLVIVDVRTPVEWRQTGVVPGTVRISLYSNWGVPNFDFAEDVLAALGGDAARPVALICATGGRSSFAAGLLRDAGFTDVADIAEGMLGSEDGLGWLSRALPVAYCGDCDSQ